MGRGAGAKGGGSLSEVSSPLWIRPSSQAHMHTIIYNYIYIYTYDHMLCSALPLTPNPYQCGRVPGRFFQGGAVMAPARGPQPAAPLPNPGACQTGTRLVSYSHYLPTYETPGPNARDESAVRVQILVLIDHVCWWATPPAQTRGVPKHERVRDGRRGTQCMHAHQQPPQRANTRLGVVEPEIRESGMRHHMRAPCG